MHDAAVAPQKNNNRMSQPVRRMNPVSIVGLNTLACLAIGSIAFSADLDAFSVFATGWVGGAIATLALLSIYAYFAADFPLERDETESRPRPDASIQDVMRAWDMDRAYEAAHGAAIRAWDADGSADRATSPRRGRVPLA
ncbi:MAG: hypothetical protein KDA50_00450 [Rhodobacteraceae bacterium]|nr:hypothetical protein [Paracoccaceae bacterium]